MNEPSPAAARATPAPRERITLLLGAVVVLCNLAAIALGVLNLQQVVRLGLLAFADDQQPIVGPPYRLATFEVTSGLPVLGLVVLPHRVNAPPP